ncbi:MAG: glycoside hydrolase, partial [Bacteroidota bacterium]
MRRILFTLLLLAGGLSLLAQEPSAFIHVDQFGYRPLAEKVAVISNPQTGQNAALSFTPGTTLEVRKASDNSTLFSAAPTIWNSGNTHTTSGD